MYPLTIKEEELKNRMATDYFAGLDCDKVVGNIDFAVTMPMPAGNIDFPEAALLWAEAKRGMAHDIYESFVQLILTIGKARTFTNRLPPAYLGAFDAMKIAFIPYSAIQDVFYQNDFNWNVTPSDHETREFNQLYRQVKQIVEESMLLFEYDKNDEGLRIFIKNNFVVGKIGATKIQIDKNNFVTIYDKWQQSVKPTIGVNWDAARRKKILDADFYLADLLSEDDVTIREKEKLYVLLQTDHYEFDRSIDDGDGLFVMALKRANFTDSQHAHRQFRNVYERPPRREYWDYIVKRRDLLVPIDIRERKGSFYTPPIWVKMSQQYLADALGENWQRNYYIWDCAAGTGNLLHGLTNSDNLWASTIDIQDVNVMHDRIDNRMLNLWKSQVFQFDFLNDDFSQLPPELRNIINDPEKRKKLVIYINPPYAEASKMQTMVGREEGSRAVEQSGMNKKYAEFLKQGNAELFAQFFTRIYFEIPDAILASFSKMKIIQGQHFIDYRNFFLAKMMKAFICPSTTFDNVKGGFPIGFMVWDTSIKERFNNIDADIYDKNANFVSVKKFYAYNNDDYINEWVKPFRAAKDDASVIGKFPFKGNDFHNQNIIALVHHNMPYNTAAGQFLINANNLMIACVYFAVRKSIKSTWLNAADQFLRPNDKWESDTDFQNDCIAYTLFKNNIQSKYGDNHWIPFSEHEVEAKDRFKSRFMLEFLKGRVFSPQAQAVFDAGRELWKYYFKQHNFNINASLYDIREYFQQRSNNKMNTTSNDEKYNLLMENLKKALNELSNKLEVKVYEYEFLK
jgi:hypothetical protein